jgi:tetratricopeptide (TPR) repeat protein
MGERHGAHFLSYAVEAVAEGNRIGRDRGKWYLHFAIERENYRAALERAIERTDCSYLNQIIPGVSRYWFRRGAGSDQQRLMRRAVDTCSSSTQTAPSLLLLYGAQMAVAGGNATLADEQLDTFAAGLHHSNEADEQMYWHTKGNAEAFGHGDPAAAAAAFSTAAKIGERLGTTRTVMSLSLLSYMNARATDQNGVDDCIQRLGRWEHRFPIWYQIAVDQSMGTLAFSLGDIDEAEWRLRRSLKSIRDAGRVASIIPATIHFGWVLLEVGKISEATVLTNAALESVEATTGRQYAALLNVKGRIALRGGDTDAAVIAFRQALQLSEIDLIYDTMAWSLVGLGQALAAAGRSSDALRALTIGDAVAQQKGLVLPATEGARIRSLREDGDTTQFAEVDAWVDDIGLLSAVRSVRLGSR